MLHKKDVRKHKVLGRLYSKIIINFKLYEKISDLSKIKRNYTNGIQKILPGYFR